jgi:hypothetical protein
MVFRMGLDITLTSKTEAWLEKKAQAAASDKASVAAKVLEEAASSELATNGNSANIAQERLRRFRQWVATVPARPGPPVDASRENIYE